MRDWLNTSLRTGDKPFSETALSLWWFQTLSGKDWKIAMIAAHWGQTHTLSPLLPLPCARLQREASSFQSAPGSQHQPQRQTPCASQQRDCLVQSQWVGGALELEINRKYTVTLGCKLLVRDSYCMTVSLSANDNFAVDAISKPFQIFHLLSL